jgi:branched-chain amino acid transport system permease protein
MNLSLLASPEVLFDQTVNGLTIGGIYALIAMGYTLVYGILFMINFAHGEIFMFGSFSGFFVLSALAGSNFTDHHPFVSVALAILGAVIVSSSLGILLERLAYRPLRKAPRLAALISAIGASIFLQNVMMLIVKARMQIYPDVFPWGLIEMGRFAVSYFQVFILAGSVVMMGGLMWFILKTRTGKAMRAVAENPDAAALMGINVNRIIVTAFVLGSALAAVAGVMVGMYYTQIDHMMGFVPGIKAFTAAVVGGIGNVAGAMIGGYFLGLAEAFSVFVLPAQYKDVVAFGLLVLILILRPRGIMGEVVSQRT